MKQDDEDDTPPTFDQTLGVECEEIVDATYRLMSYLDSCAEQLKKHKLVDLSEIEAQVLSLCERTALLPKHEAVIMVDPLQELMAKMEDVSRILGEKQEELSLLFAEEKRKKEEKEKEQKDRE